MWHGPVDVLISDSTSGAAEVLAAGLGGNKRADLVGIRTFGSASEQKVIPLEDGAALVLTVAYYYTPGNKPSSIRVFRRPSRWSLLVADPNSDNAEAPAPLSQNQLPSHDDPVFRKALDLLKNVGNRKAA